jgi:serine/threonine protein kinase
MTNELCGTAPYMAPEIARGGSYGFAVDFWALGITLYEMLVGKVRDNIL